MKATQRAELIFVLFFVVLRMYPHGILFVRYNSMQYYVPPEFLEAHAALHTG